MGDHHYLSGVTYLPTPGVKDVQSTFEVHLEAPMENVHFVEQIYTAAK